jgi:Arc/MetJ-type ribon-helix-helix transcriptional regulator
MVDSLFVAEDSNERFALGTIIIGRELEVGVSKKGGVETKANYYRLTANEMKPLASATFIKTSKDKVDFGVNVPAITDEKVKGYFESKLRENDSSVIKYLSDSILESYKAIVLAGYNNQSKVIEYSLDSLIKFETEKKARVSSEQRLTGEQWVGYSMLIMGSLIKGLSKITKKDGSGYSSSDVKTILAVLKACFTTTQAEASPIVLKFAPMVIDNLDDSDNGQSIIAANLASLLAFKLEMVSEL